MTLIVSCATPNAIYQVSDRRLTSFSAPRKVAHSNTNKLVLVNGYASFGYSGISLINGQDTSEWLTTTIAEVGTQGHAAIFEHVRARATEAFLNRDVHSPNQRQVFQIVFWYQTDLNGPISPGIAHIENAIDPSTGNWLKVPRRGFRTHVRGLSFRYKPFFWFTAGFQLSPLQKIRMKNLLKGCLTREKESPKAVIAAIAIAVRELSSSSGSDVSPIGRELSVIRIPCAAIERMIARNETNLLMAPPLPDMPTFQYLSENGSSEFWGPNMVSGTSVSTNLYVTSKPV